MVYRFYHIYVHSMPTFPDTSADTSTPTTTYSPEQIAAHNTESDCWLQIHDKVYDVTKYLDTHPGGAEVILDTAGHNATDMFEDIGHSKGARRQLEKFQVGIGELVEMKVVKNEAGGSNMALLFVALSGVLLAFVVWGRG
jgi:cytochrome b involved in lipid metabolism